MLRLIGSLSFIWLLMATSTMAQTWPAVLDADGQPLRSDPAVADVAGSLTLVARNGSCPFYVGQESARSGRRGIPVIFTPRNPQETIITESTEVTVTFSGVSTCVRNTAWTIGGEDPQTRRRFVVTGAEPSYFQINSRNQLGGSYTFQGCPQCVDEPDCGRATCGTAGILIQNGTRFLVLDGPEFTFMFVRAS
ncbi:kunitz trypsin inhibitor 4-like [Populus alba x Populus x berolinensis]|nr:kunitz trypsin inhibitor 4-like [Populus alba x Populus x berolinensis]